MTKSFSDKEAEKIFHRQFSPRRINEIVHGKRAISADTALRLARYFGMEAQFWLNLKSHYDLEVAEEALQGRLEKEVHPLEGRAA